jgi:hypothetical protein
MLSGAHVIVYSRNEDADRAFFRNVLELPAIDAGDGWLIFALPPAEVALHPAEDNDTHELYLLCDDIQDFLARMKRHGVACTGVASRGWGLLTEITLPGGGKLGVYEPRHARAASAPKPKAKRTAKSSRAPRPKRKPVRGAGRRPKARRD